MYFGRRITECDIIHREKSDARGERSRRVMFFSGVIVETPSTMENVDWNCGGCSARSKLSPKGNAQMTYCDSCFLAFHLDCCDPPAPEEARQPSSGEYTYRCCECLATPPDEVNKDLVNTFLKIGDERLFQEDDNLYLAEVIACRNRRVFAKQPVVPAYRLRFKGWSSEWDEWVTTTNEALLLDHGPIEKRCINSIKDVIDNIIPKFNVGTRVYIPGSDTVETVSDVAIKPAGRFLNEGMEECFYRLGGKERWVREDSLRGESDYYCYYREEDVDRKRKRQRK